MELLYLCNDKRKTNIQFWMGFFTQEETFGALISQASTYNFYVSGSLLLIVYKPISPFYLSCCFISDPVDCSVYNFISCLSFIHVNACSLWVELVFHV